MNGTYIKLYRKMTDWEWYDDTNCVRVFLHLLLKANWSESTYKGYNIPRGSIVTGRKALSDQLGMSEQNIRTTIKKLVKSQSINQQVTSKFSVISVCQYDTYNPDKSDANQQVTAKQPASNQQANQQVTTSKEDKKVRRKEDKKTTSVLVKEAHQLRAEKLFNRPEGRPLDKSEYTAWRSAEETVKATSEQDWQKLEAFYAAPQRETYSRKSFGTLLNNFAGELDRAANWHRKNHQPQPKLGTPTQWI